MTTTPNPTAEQIVHDTIYGTKLMEPELRTLLANDSWALTRKAVAALRAAGLLGGDPTEEPLGGTVFHLGNDVQAGEAWQTIVDAIPREVQSDWEAIDYLRTLIRWTLGSRAGVAPQEPSDKCTCPSGDGSLRWPCPSHPPAPSPGREKLIAELRRQAHSAALRHDDVLCNALWEAAKALAAPLDPEKVADFLRPHEMTVYGADRFSGCRCGEVYVDTGIGIVRWFEEHRARALCEAAKRGELT